MDSCVQTIRCLVFFVLEHFTDLGAVVEVYKQKYENCGPESSGPHTSMQRPLRSLPPYHPYKALHMSTSTKHEGVHTLLWELTYLHSLVKAKLHHVFPFRLASQMLESI